MKIACFCKQVFTVVLGCWVAALSFVSIVFFLLLQYWSAPISPTEVKKNSVLELHIGGQMAEWVPSSLCSFNSGMSDLRVIKRTIRQATEDNCINAIYLKLSYLSAGWATLEEIREILLDFKKKGKTIVAYGDNYTNKSYYLASVADEIIMNPSGYLDFKGLSATINFYTQFFENISIKPIVFRIGDYKSAVEPYYLNKMSEESRRQTEAYLSCCYEHFLSNIGLSRNIQVPDLKEFANNLSAILPNDALHANLVTRVDYEVEAKKLLKEQLHKLTGKADPSFIHYKYYAPTKKQTGVVNKIAVVVVEGEIISGPTISGYVGDRDFVKTMQAIQEDATIKALVLRINSPGGYVLPSDNMWKAIEELTKVKPVVASMSDIAASGGYYIAAPCHYIFAQPTTITGSIGIWFLLLDPTKLMQRIGIERDVVKTALSADFLNPRTSCLPSESKCMYKMLQTSYETFLHKVAQGRKLDVEQVKKLASGKVYTGRLAQSNGLVDALGGLEVAVAKAAELASLVGPYDICYMPRCKTKSEQLFSYITGNSNVKMEAFAAVAKEYPILNQLKMIHNRQPLQAMLPYTIDIE
ncbi:signal peptide peptidase SppA [Candidatus Cardinium hertigii]|jgi:protease-4|uniref:Signal peptide peptidase SppA n=1 Tax=Candidatus Cardinium hertigii TaxID=247481 RepID=A0A3N2QBH7_9BACT|nr:signal peptide peptidase SppA [Candidatus Cardinium hertigii]ROT47130.1 signal peptide peptidase SppA [Candidatus Cardinium hertigii]